MNYNKKTILIFSILFFIIITFFIKNNDYKNIQDLLVTEEILDQFKTLNKDFKIQNGEKNFRWIDKNGYTILVPANESVTIIKTSLNPVDADVVISKFFEKELTIIDRVIMNRNFVFNIENSSSDVFDQKFYDYIQSYEKGDEKCSVVVNPDFSSHPGFPDMGYSMTISCGNGFEKAKSEQMQFLEVLNLKDKNSIAILKNQRDDFYEIGVGNVRGGSTAVLKKEDGNYRVLYIGQEVPSCELIDKENIPKEVLSSIGGGDCFDKEGNY